MSTGSATVGVLSTGCVVEVPEEESLLEHAAASKSTKDNIDISLCFVVTI